MNRFFFVLTLLFLPFISYAAGGITHMYIAEQAINQLPDAYLQTLLKNNRDAYLVGAYYPDSGYIKGTSYGEESHWDPFIFAFADYLKKRYRNPLVDNPALVAFLFGCATHRVTDEITHWNLNPQISQRDFAGDEGKAHIYSESGIDIFLLVDQGLWDLTPKNWWVPIQDLLEVYKLMGSRHTAIEIGWGTKVLAAVNYGERLIATPSYLFLKWQMPWTAANYRTATEGGLLMIERKVVEYQTMLLARLTAKESVRPPVFPPIKPPETGKFPQNKVNIAATNFANAALTQGALSISTRPKVDGSIEIAYPVVMNEMKLKILADELEKKLTDN